VVHNEQSHGWEVVMVKQRTQTIVVGLDASASSAAALRWAATRAHELDSSLRIVHAWELSPEESRVGVALLRQVRAADERAKATRWAVQALGSGAHQQGRKLEVVEGAPGKVLVEAAQDADLLVVGTQEQVGQCRPTSGSVSHYCVTHSGQPVVTVPVDGFVDDVGKGIPQQGGRAELLTSQPSY
jgi:nucleotide-binding universal stress UspA family protein